MTTQTVSKNIIGKEKTQTNWFQHSGLFIVFLICGVVTLFFGSNLYEAFPTNKNLTDNLIVSAVFLVISLWFKSDKRLNRYWQIMFAFFIASAVYPVTSLTVNWKNVVMSWFGVAVVTSRGLAIDKVLQMILTVIPILLLVKLAGADFGSVYLKSGNLKLGIGIGTLVFFFLAPAAFMFAAQRFTSVDTLSAAVLWGLIFSFANGFLEELWLRGIFLKHLESLIGINGSVLLTSIVFAVMHGFAFYFMPSALPFFVLNTLALGMACGYLMMKSDSIWGAVLIHAASDYFLFIALLANA